MNAWSWLIVGLVGLLAAGGVVAASGMYGWSMHGDSSGDWGHGSSMMYSNGSGMDDEMEEHMKEMHRNGCMAGHDDDYGKRGDRGLRERAWAIASHIEEATNYTGVVIDTDPARNVIVVQLDDGRNVTFKVHRVYLDPETGYLVLGNWVTSNLSSGSTVTITGLGSEDFKLALAIYLDGQSYLVPQYYVVLQSSS